MSTFDFQTAFPNPDVVREAVQDGLRVKPWVKTSAQTGFCLRNARVVDAASGSVLDGLQQVIVENGLISSVQPQSTSASRSDHPVFDIQGRFLCPGLIDAHVHVTAVPGVKTMADMVKLADQQVTLRATYVLREMLHRGFTTVRDTGGANKFLADALKEGLIQGPRLYQCGKALSQTGGHGDFVSPGVSGGDGSSCCGGHAVSLGRTADGVPAVLKAVREELKQGADFIKVMLGGGVASESDAIETVQYTAEEVQAITTSAWQMGKKLVTAHAYTVEAINHAINNGVRGIEHGNLLDEPTAKLMAEKEVYLTPTLSCYGIMVRKPFETFLNEEGRDKSVQVMQKGLNALRLAEDAGVTVCYGSDLLISMHALQTEEFSIRSKILPAAAILRHATINPAKMLGQKGKLGVIAKGAIADLLVLSRNPLEDITVLDRPELYLDAVIKEGKVVSGQV
ncbi:amidohydrolase [Kwoniella heveanensis BCC8398]|uniref:Amidohydrolase n=1 Tax=Kwoniella heveanensis BCC8398 TaxID=1296120 RepID=A0A1B9GMA8_9TREE|nr:amidohydrolase [Kwoniella heveanensis BCC8398]